MSRAVVRASSQYLEALTAALPAASNVAFTVSAWYKPTSTANGTAFGIGDSNSSDYIALGMDGSGAAFIEVTGANASVGTLTNNVWSHIAGVQSSATSRVAYKDGTAGSANTSSFTPGPMDRTTIGGLVLNGSRVSFAGGDIAECAAWDVALTAAEIMALARGVPVRMIRPSRLVFYAPLWGTSSPERDYTINQRHLTVSGATVGTTHPRVASPFQADNGDIVPASGGASPQTISPTSIASSEAFGTATISTGPVTISPSSIGSSEAFGTATLNFSVTISPTGIASGEALGTPSISASSTLSPSGISSGGAFGTAVISTGGVTISPSGIASSGAFGTPVILSTGNQTISPTGIPSSTAFGTAYFSRGFPPVVVPAVRKRYYVLKGKTTVRRIIK